MENDLDIWEINKIFGMLQMTNRSSIWLRYVVNGLSILEMALICWKWINNLTHGLNMWEMR